jgi:hypothetical protein
VTFYGRLSFPQFTAQEAYDRSQGGKYPAASVAEAKPSFQLVVEQGQLDKFRTHVIDTFLPYCVQQEKDGEKRDALSEAEVKKLIAQIKKADFEGDYNTPFSAVHEKTQVLAPEAVATIKLIGTAGQDIELKARVDDEDGLAVNDGSVLTFPVVLPLDQSKFSMYPGCYVAVTANLYAYHNGKLPGFSAGANVAVFKTDGERFGGGVSVDEDEIFLDD